VIELKTLTFRALNAWHSPCSIQRRVARQPESQGRCDKDVDARAERAMDGSGSPYFSCKKSQKKFPRTEIFDLLRLETELYLSDVT
jgi:hypothetical protein